MIPEFTDGGYLPTGRHVADWSEFVLRYGKGEHRQKLLEGLQQMLNLLAFAGCREVRIGGSFVSNKALPKDFDGVWMKEGVDGRKLPLEIEASYLAQEDIFGGTVVSSTTDFTDIGVFIEVLEMNKRREPVGIVLLDPLHVPLAEPFPRYTSFFAAAAEKPA